MSKIINLPGKNSWFKLVVGLIIYLLFLVLPSCNKDEFDQDSIEMMSLESSAIEVAVVPFENPTLYWGPMQFASNVGRPNTVTVTISGANLCYFEDCLQLKIQNGDGSTHLVGSVVVKIDGKPIPGALDLTPSILTKNICDKTGDFTMAIMVRGEPGSYVDVWIEGAIKPNVIQDSRDGNLYRTTAINPNPYTGVPGDKMVWMAENLRYLPSVNPPLHSETEFYYSVQDYYGYDVDEAKATANYSTYGVLYNWRAILNNAEWYGFHNWPVQDQGVCPTGWHVPSSFEWYEMANYVANQTGGEMSSPFTSMFPFWTNAGAALKATFGWDPAPDPLPYPDEGPGGNGTDEFGFCGLPGGYVNHPPDIPEFSDTGGIGCWWSSTLYPEDITGAQTYWLSSWYSSIYETYLKKLSRIGGSASVRCVKDYTVSEE